MYLITKITILKHNPLGMATYDSKNNTVGFLFPGSPFTSPYLKRSDAPILDTIGTDVIGISKSNTLRTSRRKRSIPSNQIELFCEDIFRQGSMYELVDFIRLSDILIEINSSKYIK